VLRKHVGCASTPAGIETLRLKSRQILYQLEHAGQISLFKGNAAAPTAKLVNWRITGFHQVFGTVYDQLGFPYTLLRDLVVARIVYPKSKAGTRRYLSRYLGITIKKNRLYRFLDTLNKDQLTKIAYDFVTSRHTRGISVCFYDVTTLYFETTKEDDLRQKGFSKDHRMDMPQILVGLFVDSQGYPFDFNFYEGKTFEGHTFVNAMEAIRSKYAFPTLTVVADAGMLSKDNLSYLDSVKINYIVGARLKNLSHALTKRILRHLFQKRPIFQTVAGNQQLIVDYSIDRAKQDKKNRDHTITKLKQKLEAGKAMVRRSKYLLVQGKNKIVGINDKQVASDQQFDGLKGYFINKDNSNPVQDIINQYHQLWQVEKAFRMSKHDLQERPIFHYRLRRIKAHLTLCFVSLLVIREAERQLLTINYSLKQAIELLGKVGQGIVRVGSVELITESDPDPATQAIHKLFKGH